MRQLHNDIVEILVKSIYSCFYVNHSHLDKRTARDILNQEQNAVDYYRLNPMFHAIVNKVAALICDTIERHGYKCYHPQDILGKSACENIEDLNKNLDLIIRHVKEAVPPT